MRSPCDFDTYSFLSLEQIKFHGHKDFEDNLGKKMISNLIRLSNSTFHLRVGDSIDFACHGSSNQLSPPLPLSLPTSLTRQIMLSTASFANTILSPPSQRVVGNRVKDNICLTNRDAGEIHWSNRIGDNLCVASQP